MLNLDTIWTELGQPRPRSEPVPYTEHVWDAASMVPLPIPDIVSPSLSVFDSRQSRRTFGPLDNASLASLMWHVAACRGRADSALGFPIEHRGVPSAGAIHPVHILICDPITRVIKRYDGLSHALWVLEQEAPAMLVSACEEVLPAQNGKLLFFAADPGKTAAKYDSPISLIWRDAGVLQGGLALAAEALGLNFCLLGITGDPWIAQLSQEGKLRGVGVALVGSRP